MLNPHDILSSDFYYDLPANRIPPFPLTERNLSKLLVYKNNAISEDQFFNLAEHIEKDHLLVFNDTKVIYARIEFHKASGARIEVFCLEPHEPSDYAQSFAQKYSCQWKCMVGNLKKWKESELVKKINVSGKEILLSAKYMKAESTYHIIEFEWNTDHCFADILESCGEIPIPPYLERKSEETDYERYQTIYSKTNGSVAAPTAGLHFTQNEFEKLALKNVEVANLTLHVGAGTFRPLQSITLGEHNMHTEHFIISLEFIQKLIKFYPKIIAVGTTSVRTLESLFFISEQIQNNENSAYLHVNQWDAYDQKINTSPLFALKCIEKYMLDYKISNLSASTSIMIVPGYNFKYVSGIITNFHQPQSTLLALVAAFVGDKWKDMYQFALENEFRFLSYGDSSLVISNMK